MTHTKSPLKILALGLTAASLALTGCTITVPGDASAKESASESSSPESTPSETNSPESESPSPSDSPSSEAPSPAPAPSSPAAGADASADKVSINEMVAPGSTVKIGQNVKFYERFGKPDKDYYNEFMWDVKLTSIDQGSPADLSALRDAGTKYAGYTPFYVRGEMSLLGKTRARDSIANFSSTSYFKPVLEGGAAAGRLTIIGTFDKCTTTRTIREVGQRGTFCVIAMAPTGTTVSGAKFTGYSSNYDNYTDNPYTKQPVTFTK